MPKVCFIRHAESQSNIGGRSQDPVAIELSPRGLDDAKAIPDRFSTPPALILTSRDVRTKQTARYTLETFPSVPHEEWEIHEFTYLSPPKYRNTTLLERLPDVNKFWSQADPLYKDGEGAESFEEFIERCRRVVDKLRSRQGGLILAFSHQQFIAGIKWLLEGRLSKLDQKTMCDFRVYHKADPIKNCGMVEFDL